MNRLWTLIGLVVLLDITNSVHQRSSCRTRQASRRTPAESTQALGCSMGHSMGRSTGHSSGHRLNDPVNRLLEFKGLNRPLDCHRQFMRPFKEPWTAWWIAHWNPIDDSRLWISIGGSHGQSNGRSSVRSQCYSKAVYSLGGSMGHSLGPTTGFRGRSLTC